MTPEEREAFNKKIGSADRRAEKQKLQLPAAAVARSSAHR
jgi:hypothetical protein